MFLLLQSLFIVMGKLLNKLYPNISLVDRYIINQLIPSFVFALAICTILGELIGITFEQVKFVANYDLPVAIAARVHYLKLPAFISLGLPFALLMATIITYGQLSAKSEIVALHSFGISLYRLLVPTIAIALLMTLVMFVFQEFVVPPANYQAAMILEKEWGVDRTQLAKYNKREIIYQEFEKNNSNLKLLFIADRFNGKQMQGVTLLKYQQQKLTEIITSQAARWDEKKQLWQLFSGRQIALDSHSGYAQTNNFEVLPYKLSKNILDYANHHRDRREMNIVELYRRLEIIKNTADFNKIRQLKISIQERYALPFSCLIFAFLGCTLGTSVTTESKSKSNSFGIAILAIFTYYSSQFLSASLSVTGIITVFWGAWLPNLLGLAFGFYLLKYRCNS